jgi:hypothetical protein
VGYVQKGKHNDEFMAFSSYNKSRTTCFGEPEGSMDFDVDFNETSHGYLVTWTEPRVINAPRICYYTVGILLEGKSGEKELRVDGQRRITLTDVNVPVRARIQISAVNVHSCYVQMYPLYNQCWTAQSGKLGITFYLDGLSNSARNLFRIKMDGWLFIIIGVHLMFS